MSERTEISIVAAYSENMVIGRDGRIPWNIADEKKRFRELTTGNVVVMGRRTYEEIGFPLPNRETIVVSNKCTYEADNCRTAGSLSEAIHMAAGKKIYISGGAGLYEEALPLAGKLYITEIHRIVEGDTYFPEFDKKEYERIVEKHVEGEWSYTYVTYTRR